MFRKKTDNLNHVTDEEPDNDGLVRTVCGILKRVNDGPDPDLNFCTECTMAVVDSHNELARKYSDLQDRLSQVFRIAASGRNITEIRG